ncbi:alpha/beta-hydrolase, partial [Decorospora gaudefroyi]
MTSKPATHPTFTFHHAELGPMTGVVTPENVVQFRGVPFATIPARFKRSILLNSLPETNTDFTQFGCASPQTFTENDITGGGPFPGEVFPPPADEFNCLNLQLNIPLVHLQSVPSPKLPVLVYIHGGGFVLGKIDEQHNTALLVQQSLFDAQPIIAASIQYRLGALGYLHTSEPRNANLALNDQRNALLWIQRFVGGFGGDALSVTVFGESAGSMSICAHMLCSPPASGPLFQKVVLMSGVIGPATAPMSVQEAERMYEAFVEEVGVQERGEAGLRKLRELDLRTVMDASAKLSEDGMMWLSVQDQQWFGGPVTWDRIPELMGKCEWVGEIVLGTTSFEGTMFLPRLTGITPHSFLTSISNQLCEHSAALVRQAYNITPSMDQNLFTTAALRWMGDVLFDAPTHSLAQYLTTHTTKKVYRYLFDIRNPFPGSALYQQPHHWVDIYFVFKTYQFRYPTQNLRALSTRHAQLWTSFASGDAPPWSAYRYTGRGDEVIMVADER